MFRNLSNLFSGICVAAALLLIVVSAQANGGVARAEGSNRFSATHSTLSGQLALRGRVLNANGLGVSGAKVYLYAWPMSWPGKHVPRPGARVPMGVVGRGVSGTDGRYAVRISAPRVLLASAAPGGLVNLMARVAGPGIGFYSFSLRTENTRTGPVLTILTAPPGHPVPRAATLPISGTAVHLSGRPNDFCYVMHTKFVKNYRREWGNIDASYMRRSEVKAWVNYKTTQSTTFGVGFKFDPNYGPSSEHYQTQFVPSLYHITYSPGNCSANYTVHPSKQTGGNHVQYKIRIPKTPKKWCVPEPPGQWSKSTTTASTISGGLTIPEIGFTASAQTGWSTTDTLYYQNVHKHHGFALCGVHDDPGGAPGAVVAGRPR